MNKTASALGFAGLGFLLIWSGVTNAGVLSTVQSLVAGSKPIPGQPQPSLFKGGSGVSGASLTLGGTVPAGSGGGNTAIAQGALKYVGDRYVWGGHGPVTLSNGSTEYQFDCYGLLTYVLHHDLGYNLPNNTHSGYLEFMAWNGAYRVSASQIQAGDLIIWPTHSGIAISSTEMVSAENPSQGVKVNTFTGGGPLAPEPMTVLRVGSQVSA